MPIVQASPDFDLHSGAALKLINPTSSAWGEAMGEGVVDKILGFWVDIMLTILPIIALSVLLWVAYELFTAGWNEEKWKKAWKTLVYMIVGLVVTMAAYALVRMVAWINL